MSEMWADISPANKFHDGARDGKHYWLTPPDLYARQRDESLLFGALLGIAFRFRAVLEGNQLRERR
jgi:hypothetical protein